VKPLKEDGTSFYYSDYNNIFARKGYYKDKWPCCSGTFPQLTADYGISSYFHQDDSIYVNLFAPSRVTWSQGGARVSLTQRTTYPLQLSTQIEISMEKPTTLVIHLRIPGWAGPKTSATVNGRRIPFELTPGSFARLDGPFRNGDRIEVEFDATTSLESADPQHPSVVAPVHGLLTLFAVGNIPTSIQRTGLLNASPISKGSDTWTATMDSGTLTLKPFASIQDELYRLYHQVQS
jgi:uncharacterized protein